MVKALLSDIDGTLVQSNWLHAEAWQVAFGAIGIHLDVETVRRQIGKGGDELLPVFVQWWKRDHVAEPIDAFRAYIFRQEMLPKVTAFAGTRPLLERCRAAGIRVALASSAKKQDIGDYKRIANIEDLVELETSADDVAKAKPHPDIFEVALSKLGLKASECIALGDTPYDAESAGHAGLRTIGVESGGWTRGELLEAGFAEVYKDVGDLLANFEQSAIMREGLR